MSAQDVVTVALCSLVGAAAGAAWAGGAGAVLGVIAGAAWGVLANRLLVRPAIAVSVFTGTVVGAYLGRSIVRALCLPGSCVALEVVAAVLLGAGAFVGVGLVAALVTRSFDEYREIGKPPP
ncbi:MAG: hypothetical protein EHM57_03865 [Actinobacteria bacterium]|nr:MAG: hypothetical protein EHM57_03865 [Actinomycetota bacterium]